MKQGRAYLVSLSCWLLSSCANIVTPTGGPKDTTPPKIAHEHPENFSKRFTGNIIAIEFDEYIKLENASQEVVLSPSIEPPPEFTVKGKQLIIKWKAQLDSATTYTIAFGDALKDANESNPLSGFKYVFSTGDEIDSLSVTGTVKLAKEDKPASKMIVMLYKDFADSTVIKKKPYYFTKTNDAGVFSLENIKAGEYLIFALKDENFNYRYDLPNEEIAFLDSTITVDDSTKSITLSLFQEDRVVPLKLIEKDNSKPEYVRLIFSAKTDTIELVSMQDALPIGITEYNTAKDTATIWYNRSWAGDSLVLKLNGAATDTFTVRNKPESLEVLKEKLSPLSLFTKARETYPFKDTLSVYLNRPAMHANFENMILTQDSPVIELKLNFIYFANSAQRKIALDFPRTPGNAYTLFLPPGTFTDHFGMQSDTIEWRIATKTKEDYGSLKLDVNGTENRNYIIQLLDGNDAVTTERSFTGSTSFYFDALPPGTYQPLIIFDENANKKWDTGDYLNRIQPEATYRHPEPISLRANWDLEVELKIK